MVALSGSLGEHVGRTLLRLGHQLIGTLVGFRDHLSGTLVGLLADLLGPFSGCDLRQGVDLSLFFDLRGPRVTLFPRRLCGPPCLFLDLVSAFLGLGDELLRLLLNFLQCTGLLFGKLGRYRVGNHTSKRIRVEIHRYAGRIDRAGKVRAHSNRLGLGQV